MSEWIKCSDRLPPTSGSYLVLKPHSAYKHGIYEWLQEEQSWEQEWHRKKRSELKPRTWVTHWMPLPEPPENV